MGGPNKTAILFEMAEGEGVFELYGGPVGWCQ